MSPHNLTPPLTALVGRATLSAHILDRLRSGERWLGLVAGPGVGKSRLALDVATRAANEGAFPGGIYWFEPASDGLGDMLRGLVTTLGLRADHIGEEPEAALRRQLATLGEVLLVLDGGERLLARAAERVGAWLADAPGARILVTSRVRHPLPGLAWEPVPPLADPDAEALFIAHVEALRPGLTADTAWREGLPGLLERLDGNPQAIALTAARATMLAPNKLLARLDANVGLALRGPNGGGSGLWAAMDESWRALDPADRDVLTQLAFIRVPMSFEVFEAVIRVEAAEPSPGELAALEALQRLVERSWIVLDGPAHEPRFRLFHHVAGFVRERAESGAALAREVEARLQRWAVALATRAAPRWLGLPNRDVRAALIDGERLLLRSAASLAARLHDDPGAPVDLARILSALSTVILRRGQSEEVRRLFDAIAPCLDGLEAPARAAVRVTWAVELGQGRSPTASALYDAAVADAIESGSTFVEGAVRRQAARFQRWREPPWLVAELERATALLDDAGEAELHATTLSLLGVVRSAAGAFDDARAAFHAAIDTMRARGFEGALAITLNNLAQLDGWCGDWDRAEASLRAALPAAEADRNTALVAVIRNNLGQCALRVGRIDEAGRHFDASMVACRAIGDRRTLGVGGGYQAALAWLAGDDTTARARARAARADLAAAFDDPVAESLVMAMEALAEARSGDAQAAATTMAAATARAARVADPNLQGALEIHTLHVEVLTGRRGSEEAIAAARRLAEAARHAPVPAGMPSRVHQVDHALTLWVGRDAMTAGTHETAPPPARADARVLTWDGQTLTTPEGEALALAKKPVLRRLVTRLVAARREARGTGLSVDDLFEAAWPGDRTGEPWRSNRVYVAIAKLRSAALRDVLLHDGDGYLLDPALALEVAPRE